MRFYCTVLVAATVMASSVRGDLFISGYDAFASPRTARYDETTGALLWMIGPTGEAPTAGLAVGPDHQLYLAGQSFEVAHLYRATGSSPGYVVQPSYNPFRPANGWTRPQETTFGPDGNIYVTSNYHNSYGSFSTDGILKYKTDGTYLGKFANTSGAYLTFAPNGDLLVSTGHLGLGGGATVDVRRFRGSDGAALGVFVAAGAGGLDRPRGLAFGPDGNLYVVSSHDRVLRFDGNTGVFIDTFVSPGAGGLQGASDLAFDSAGNLNVCNGLGFNSYITTSVLKYDGSTGAFVGVLVPPTVPTNTQGLRGGWFMTFGYIPEPSSAIVILSLGALLIRRSKHYPRSV